LHFRTSDNKEVDFVLERPDGRLAGIEVKSSDRVRSADFKGLKVLQEVAGDDFISGIVLYTGKDVVPFGEKFLSMSKHPYPIIDLFAGPGGLGEGFSSFHDNLSNPVFHSVVSIERDEFSHRTLLLRHFLRSFQENTFPQEYYDYLAGGTTVDQLFGDYPEQYKAASETALKISLGPENHETVKKIVTEAKMGI